jgi:hypothetical protein
MASTAQHSRANFQMKRVIPLNDGYLTNTESLHHFTDIRQKDIMVITRRVAPRSMYSRQMGQPYSRIVESRKPFVSRKKAEYVMAIPRLDVRPLFTRRLDVPLKK